MVTLGSGTRVRPSPAESARKAGQKFAAKIDANGDGSVSEAEIEATNQRERTASELVSFHDVDDNGIVSVAEVADSWVMYATAMLMVQQQHRHDEF